MLKEVLKGKLPSITASYTLFRALIPEPGGRTALCYQFHEAYLIISTGLADHVVLDECSDIFFLLALLRDVPSCVRHATDNWNSNSETRDHNCEFFHLQDCNFKHIATTQVQLERWSYNLRSAVHDHKNV